MAEYPLPKFHFRVEWDDTEIGFTEVSGLEIETELIEYREGNNKEYSTVKMPGLKSYSNLTLKRGVFKSENQFYDWFNSIKLNSVDRHNITISLLNEEHEPVVVWKIKNAWPVKIVSTDLKSDDNEVAIEELEIAHEGLTIQND